MQPLLLCIQLQPLHTLHTYCSLSLLCIQLTIHRVSSSRHILPRILTLTHIPYRHNDFSLPQIFAVSVGSFLVCWAKRNLREFGPITELKARKSELNNVPQCFGHTESAKLQYLFWHFGVRNLLFPTNTGPSLLFVCCCDCTIPL